MSRWWYSSYCYYYWHSKLGYFGSWISKGALAMGLCCSGSSTPIVRTFASFDYSTTEYWLHYTQYPAN